MSEDLSTESFKNTRYQGDPAQNKDLQLGMLREVRNKITKNTGIELQLDNLMPLGWGEFRNLVLKGSGVERRHNDANTNTKVCL